MTIIRKGLFLCVTVLALSFAAQAQNDDRGLSCDSARNWGRNWTNSCRMQEMTLPVAGGLLTVDGRGNGSVTIKGWDKNEIFLRAQIMGFAKNQAEADTYGQQARVVVNGATIRGEGPAVVGSGGWSISFEVFVPRRSDLALKASNGSLLVSEVAGNVELNTTNGSVYLRNVGGNVRGGTVNGSINVELEGATWQGEGLDVKTINGTVKLALPDNFNAHLETRTVNGGIHFDFPITVVGKIDHEINTNIGAGGPPIRVQTTNGGVSIKRK